MKVLTAAAMRACDEAAMAAGTPGAELMARAGAALADAVSRERGDLPVVFVCGRGNNGGDGLAAAALVPGSLVYEVPGARSPDCAGFSEKCPSARVAGRTDLPERYLAVDCVLGTGFHGAVAAELAPAFDLLRGARRVVACDLPSGLNADNGRADPMCVSAARTVTFAAAKYGHFLGDGKDFCGALEVADIGIPIVAPCAETVTADGVAALFPPRRQNCHKGSFEKIFLVGGSAPYQGSVALSALAEAALRTGCGYATVVCPRNLGSLSCLENTFLFAGADRLAYDEAVLERACGGDLVVCGMGMGTEGDAPRIVAYLARQARRVLFDADALNVLAARPELLREAQAELYLTPHPGEFARLAGVTTAEVAADPVGLADRFAAEFGVNLLLKGVSSYATDGARRFLNTVGSPALAKAGSGDALDGFAAVPVCRAGFYGLAAAAYLHGRAAQLAAEELTEHGVLASDLPRYAGRALCELRRARES